MKSIWKYAVFSVKKSKTLKIMRLLMIFCFFFISGAMANSYSQEQVVSLDLHKCDVNTLCQEIWKQTGLRFIYNEEHVKDLKAFNVKASGKTVREVLDEVFRNTSLRYFFEQDIIYITNKDDDNKKKESKTVTGTVKDRRGEPLPGVTVLVKGTSVGVVSDIEGKFKIAIPRDTVTFIFSFVGMKRQEVKYIPGKKLDIVMDEDVEEMEEVVITGYQKIDKRHLTSAVTTLKADDINVAGISTIDKMLEGHVPGMIFMQNSGQVGAAPKLRIRGSSTVLGSREPLWVLDGIILHDPVNVDPSQINDLDFVNLLGNAISGLNPDDIEQIDVLKDASATALYGTRAANGVIVITTKKGKIGPPTVSYSMTGSLSLRPRYGDREVNMMNSEERMAFSRELIEKGVMFTRLNAWVGYEAAISDYWNGKMDFDEFQSLVSRYETTNTDWFKLLCRDAFSHNHTLSLSGGTDNIRYYASLGYNDEKGVLKGEQNKRYSTNLNVTANYNKFSARFALQANVNEKSYTPEEIDVLNYAFNTARTIPAYNEDGSLYYYDRIGEEDGSFRYPFNILNEVRNSSRDIETSGFTFNTSINYKFTSYLNAGLTISYSNSNTNEETYRGEETFYANELRDRVEESGKSNYMPFGGELNQLTSRNKSYTVRLQTDFNKFLDAENIHLITASIGGELSSTRYRGLRQTRRCYIPGRGEIFAPVDINEYPLYGTWLATDELARGKRTNSLTNMMSGYFTLSYSYRDRYVLTFNTRSDASNKFGSKSNSKFLPIWAIAGRWNTKEDVLKTVNWVDLLSLRVSFGYQGNMLDSQTPELIIKKGDPNNQFGNKYESTVNSFPNPNLKWEKTSSLNVGLDFSFLNTAIKGTVSYYYKKTTDAFLSKTISEINGITNYTVNSGTIENQGWEMSLNFIPFNPQGGTDGFRWSIDPQIGQVLNKLLNRAINNKDKVTRDEITYADYLSGNVEIPGRSLNSFYSYKFKGLDPNDGRPMFYDIELDEVKEKYLAMDEKEEVYKTVMKYSGCRVPVLQGSINNKLSYKRLVLGFNFTYSLGSKIRLMKLYPNLSGSYGTLAPQPHQNVRREYLKRWQKAGDEMYTDIPGIVGGTEFTNSLSPWWRDYSFAFGSNIWEMYDNSNIRVVSGNYLRLSSMTLRYLFTENLCKKMHLRSASIEFTGTNLFTLCNKKLKGQDPATQSGSSPTINMSIRPTYSCRLNITF